MIPLIVIFAVGFILALLFVIGAGRRVHDADEIMDRHYQERHG